MAVEKALEKDPAERYQTMRDLVVDLRRVARQKTETAAAPIVLRARVRWLPWVAVAALAGAGLIAVGMVWARGDVPRTVERSAQFTLSLAAMPAGHQPTGFPRPSPDGQFLAFAASDPAGRSSLWIRSLDSLQIRQLPGTEGVDGAVIWSPDGRWIGFYADGKLRKSALPEALLKRSSNCRDSRRRPGARGAIFSTGRRTAPRYSMSRNPGDRRSK